MAGIQIAKYEDVKALEDEISQKADADHSHDGEYQPVGDYATKGDLNGKSDVGHTHDYNDISNPPTIPTDNAQLNNGAGYINGHYDNSTSGLTATDIQGAIDELKALIDNMSAQ